MFQPHRWPKSWPRKPSWVTVVLMKPAKWGREGGRRLPQASPPHPCRYSLMLWSYSHVLSLKNCCPFCRILCLHLIALLTCGSMGRRWKRRLEWSMARLPSVNQVLRGSANYFESKVGGSCNHRPNEDFAKTVLYPISHFIHFQFHHHSERLVDNIDPLAALSMN